MSNGTLPRTDLKLVEWGDNAVSFLTAGFASYGLTSAQSAQFIAAQTAWKSSYLAASNMATRTKAKIAAKDDQRKLFRKQAANTVAIVKAFNGITNELLTNLMIDIRPSTQTPIPPPGQLVITVDNVDRNYVNVNLKELGQTGSTKRRPPGTKGATILYFVGNAPPIDSAAWSLSGNTTRAKFAVEFPAGTPAGTQVWIAGFWFNDRTESGLLSVPVATYLGYSGEGAGTLPMSIAA